MDGFLVIFMFFWGLCFGSFYNVVIYRIPRGLNIAKGRSFCPTCDHSLLAADLIPLFSFLFLGGKCRYCREKIPWRYPLIEFFTGILFAIGYGKFSLSFSLIQVLVFWSMLLIVAVIDFDQMYIYDVILLFFSLIQILLILVLKQDIKGALFGALIGGAVYFVIHIVSKAYYKREVFGLGDVFLMASIGLFVGKEYIVLASFLPFYLSIFVLIGTKLAGKKVSMQSELPFGPFMCVGGWLMSMYGHEIKLILLSLMGQI